VVTEPPARPPRDGDVSATGIVGERRDPADDSARYTVEAPGADEVAAVPWPLLLRRRLSDRMAASPRYSWLVLGTTLFGLFTVAFTITILSVSLASIADDLGSTVTTLTWVITGPLLAFGIVGPAFGKAGDLYGHKRMYLLGLTGSGVAALGSVAAWDAGSLIAFRVLGAGFGAACGPASMALIYSVFPPERRVQAMGYWSMVMAGGPVLGVVAGGPVVEALGWRWIFVMQAPLALFAALVALLLLPETARLERTRFDIPGAVLLGVGVTSVLLALNRGPELGWSSPLVVGGFVAAPLLIGSFVAWERRVEHPLIRLEYLRRRNVAAPIATQFFTNFAYMGGFIITPLLLAQGFGYGETRIGLLVIARPFAFALSAPLGGVVALRVGERVAGVFGAASVAVSMVALAQLRPGVSDLVVVGALALSGLGLGASSPSMAATIANAVDEADLGIAGAAQQLITQVGVVAGIQLMQTVQAARAGAVGLIDSYQEAYLLGGAVAALGIVSASFVQRTARRRPAAG
jgi:EmrB/QacA subfamily drug resistance transporter